LAEYEPPLSLNSRSAEAAFSQARLPEWLHYTAARVFYFRPLRFSGRAAAGCCFSPASRRSQAGQLSASRQLARPLYYSLIFSSGIESQLPPVVLPAGATLRLYFQILPAFSQLSLATLSASQKIVLYASGFHIAFSLILSSSFLFGIDSQYLGQRLSFIDFQLSSPAAAAASLFSPYFVKAFSIFSASPADTSAS